ncbi:cytochrome P450 [Pseudovirgaria hyperparasitica]|uniref:Cytochrome P450 n=1 Tax=Pseudovirgaria hyperparasitica TaxID=470096 RepID=A0A6A6VUK6_9PEZI|nr:cytochrome P450 [Pseudovirgaria hyperparasitica]KAF2754368.1 cytochrome P450 [Pseudovirgaria hyperparasitica]
MGYQLSVFENVPTSTWLILLTLSTCVGYSLFWVLRGVYRLYLHPLSRYPGPKLAIVDPAWFELVYNYWGENRCMLVWQLEKFHQTYGPVVRLGPNTLHINDPEIYQRMAKVTSGFLKDPDFYQLIMLPSVVSETDPKKHRVRRQVLAPAFSISRVTEHAKWIESKAESLNSRLEQFAHSDTPVNVLKLCNAFIIDIATRLLLATDHECVLDPDFRSDFVDLLHAVLQQTWLAFVAPTTTRAMYKLPPSIQKWIFPLPIRKFAQSRRVRSDIIEQLIDPNAAKGHVVPQGESLMSEVIILMTAAVDTSSTVMYQGIYQICRNNDIYKSLVRELDHAFPGDSKITYKVAKQLPYLTAVIQESLRWASPVPGRLPRQVPAEGFELYGHRIPGGTIMQTSAILLNNHKDVFSHPEQFDPDRWTQGETSRELEKYMVSFYHGSRGCLGKDLAWCEMYVFMANLFRRFSVSVHDTTDKDMKFKDSFLSL